MLGHVTHQSTVCGPQEDGRHKQAGGARHAVGQHRQEVKLRWGHRAGQEQAGGAAGALPLEALKRAIFVGPLDMFLPSCPLSSCARAAQGWVVTPSIHPMGIGACTAGTVP
jgi:hypothetical protein